MSPDVVIRILGESKAFRDELGKVKGEAQGLGQAMGAVGGQMTTRFTLPIVAGFGLATKAGAEENQQMEVLANTIRNNIVGATDAQIAANEKWITSMQNTTGVADGDMRDAMQHLLVSGMSIEEAQAALATAMDVSAAKGKDLGAVTEAMAKANQGNIGALGRLGVATKDQEGRTLSLDQIMANLNKTMGGAAAEAADTAAGRAEIMKLKMADAAENIGMILIPVLEKLTGWLSNITDWFNNLDPGVQQFIVGALGVVAAVGPVLVIGSKLVGSFKLIGSTFMWLSRLMMTNPWLLLIAAVIALVVLIVKNWDKIKEVLSKVWGWIKETAGKVGEWIKDAFNKAVEFVKNLFLNFTPLGLIIKNFDKIKDVATKAKDWIVDKFSAVIEWFKKLPGRIVSAVGDWAAGLKDGFRRAINWIIDKWNNFKIEIKLPSILGGSTLTINTPNIPKFHSGAARVPGAAGSQMLAWVQAGETITPAGMSAGGVVFAPQIGNLVGPGGINELFEMFRAFLIDNQRRNGTTGIV